MCPRCERFMCCSACLHPEICAWSSKNPALSLSYPLSNMGGLFFFFFFTFARLSINFSGEDAGTVGGLFSLTLADSSAVLIRCCFQKIKVPLSRGGPAQTLNRILIFMCNQWSSQCRAIPPLDRAAFSGSNREAESQQLKC